MIIIIIIMIIIIMIIIRIMIIIGFDTHPFHFIFLWSKEPGKHGCSVWAVGHFGVAIWLVYRPCLIEVMSPNICTAEKDDFGVFWSCSLGIERLAVDKLPCVPWVNLCKSGHLCHSSVTQWLINLTAFHDSVPKKRGLSQILQWLGSPFATPTIHRMLLQISGPRNSPRTLLQGMGVDSVITKSLKVPDVANLWKIIWREICGLSLL